MRLAFRLRFWKGKECRGSEATVGGYWARREIRVQCPGLGQSKEAYGEELVE